MSYHTKDHDIQVREYADMCRYFDYEEVRDIIYKNRTGDLIDIIQGDSGVDTANMEEAMGACVSGESLEKFVDIRDIALKADSAGEVGYSLNLDKFSSFLEKLRNNQSESGIVIGKIRDCIENVTYEGKVQLSLEQIREILLFGVLFAYVNHIPKDEDFAILKKFLNISISTAGRMILQHNKNLEIRKPIEELPCYKEAGGEETLCLELITIHNVLDEPALITLKDSPIQRHLAPGEQILALTERGTVITFLPRMCVSKEWVVYQAGSHLEAQRSGDRITLPLESEESVFFSESPLFGFMIAEKSGKFYGSQFKGEKPSKKVCYLKGDLQNYGFLFSDGSYAGHEAYTNWSSLLFFQLGGGKGVAVTADRKAIDCRGKKLGDDVAAVSCCGERYALLKMDGTVVTNQGRLEGVPIPARAVCTDAYGCWISTDDTLFYWDGNEKRSVCSLKEQPMDEIEQDGSGEYVAGRFVENGIQRLR